MLRRCELTREHAPHAVAVAEVNEKSAFFVCAAFVIVALEVSVVSQKQGRKKGGFLLGSKSFVSELEFEMIPH